MREQYFMRWRENFDDQEGWFSFSELEKEVERIKKLVAEADGEATIYMIIYGQLVTEQFK